jgi:hypothetical protein
MKEDLRVDDYLEELSRRGVSLWLEGGVLRYKCRRGSLPSSDLDQLRVHKPRIIASLARSAPSHQRIPQRLPTDTIPLTSIQRGMWNAFERLKLTKSKRTMAAAVRLTGELNLELVRRSIAHVVRRHEALRTRIVLVDAGPLQEVDNVTDIELAEVDLSSIPATEREQAARRAVDEFIDIPISLTGDDLFACRVIKLRETEHILVTALDHVIVDNLSMHILWNEIDTVYTDLFVGRAISLAPVEIQFPDYAVWEQRHQWTPQKSAFWNSRINDHRVRLPRGEGLERGERLKIEEIPIQLGPVLTVKLKELSRNSGTTVVMAVLTAYLATTLIWAKQSVITSGFVITGRNIPGLEQTIGWFGSLLFLRVTLSEDDTFRTLLERVTREYYLAVEYADHGRVTLGRPRCMWNTSFNWRVGLDATQPPALARVKPDQPKDGVTGTPFEFARPLLDIDWSDDPDLLDGEPGVLFADEPDGIAGAFIYRPDLFSADTMHQFCSSFAHFVGSMCDSPDGRVR